jgi:hypothetical protein
LWLVKPYRVTIAPAAGRVGYLLKIVHRQRVDWVDLLERIDTASPTRPDEQEFTGKGGTNSGCRRRCRRPCPVGVYNPRIRTPVDGRATGPPCAPWSRRSASAGAARPLKTGAAGRDKLVLVEDPPKDLAQRVAALMKASR